jgi:hypothetical protein
MNGPVMRPQRWRMTGGRLFPQKTLLGRWPGQSGNLTILSSCLVVRMSRRRLEIPLAATAFGPGDGSFWNFSLVVSPILSSALCHDDRWSVFPACSFPYLPPVAVRGERCEGESAGIIDGR